MRVRLLFLTVIALVTATACSAKIQSPSPGLSASAGATSSPSSTSALPGVPADLASVVDRVLSATEVTYGPDDILPPGDTTKFWLRSDGRFDAFASPCYMDGTYTLDAGRLSIDPDTASGSCGRPPEEWWFARLLSERPYINVEGEDVLIGTTETGVRFVDTSYPASWTLATPTTADARSLSLVITEMSCADGESPEGRVLEPQIEYGQEEISISIRVRVRSWAPTCPPNPTYPLTVELSEPVGDRRVVEGPSFDSS
jgi:hypothetical protein